MKKNKFAKKLIIPSLPFQSSSTKHLFVIIIYELFKLALYKKLKIHDLEAHLQDSTNKKYNNFHFNNPTKNFNLVFRIMENIRRKSFTKFYHHIFYRETIWPTFEISRFPFKIRIKVPARQ